MLFGCDTASRDSTPVQLAYLAVRELRLAAAGKQTVLPPVLPGDHASTVGTVGCSLMRRKGA